VTCERPFSTSFGSGVRVATGDLKSLVERRRSSNLLFRTVVKTCKCGEMAAAPGLSPGSREGVRVRPSSLVRIFGYGFRTPEGKHAGVAELADALVLETSSLE
jgi:hypothetical protein